VLCCRRYFVVDAYYFANISANLLVTFSKTSADLERKLLQCSATDTCKNVEPLPSVALSGHLPMYARRQSTSCHRVNILSIIVKRLGFTRDPFVRCIGPSERRLGLRCCCFGLSVWPRFHKRTSVNCFRERSDLRESQRTMTALYCVQAATWY